MLNDSNDLIIVSLALIALAVVIAGSYSKLSPEAIKLVETICVGLIGIAVGRSTTK